MRTKLLICAIFTALCAGAAESVAKRDCKAVAELGDAAAQFRYAEMLC